MFRCDPDKVIDELVCLVDSKNSRISVKEAADSLISKGLDLGSNPQETVRALVSLADSNVLNLRAGAGGGIGRPSMFKNKTVKRGDGLVALMRQALAQGDSVEEVKAKLNGLVSETEDE